LEEEEELLRSEEFEIELLVEELLENNDLELVFLFSSIRICIVISKTSYLPHYATDSLFVCREKKGTVIIREKKVGERV